MAILAASSIKGAVRQRYREQEDDLQIHHIVGAKCCHRRKQRYCPPHLLGRDRERRQGELRACRSAAGLAEAGRSLEIVRSAGVQIANLISGQWGRLQGARETKAQPAVRPGAKVPKKGYDVVVRF